MFESVSEELRRNHEQENQWSRHLQPIGEVAGEEEAEHHRDEGDPRTDLSPQKFEERVRQTEEDVGDEERGEHVRSPVRPIQDQ